MAKQGPLDPGLFTPQQKFSKGDDIWYRHRSGVWMEGKVTHVDLSLQPPSYQVETKSDSIVRDTEGPRLRPRVPGEAPPPPGDAAALQPAAADTGDATGPASSSPNSAPPNVPAPGASHSPAVQRDSHAPAPSAAAPTHHEPQPHAPFGHYSGHSGAVHPGNPPGNQPGAQPGNQAYFAQAHGPAPYPSAPPAPSAWYSQGASSSYPAHEYTHGPAASQAMNQAAPPSYPRYPLYGQHSGYPAAAPQAAAQTYPRYPPYDGHSGYPAAVPHPGPYPHAPAFPDSTSAAAPYAPVQPPYNNGAWQQQLNHTAHPHPGAPWPHGGPGQYSAPGQQGPPWQQGHGQSEQHGMQYGMQYGMPHGMQPGQHSFTPLRDNVMRMSPQKSHGQGYLPAQQSPTPGGQSPGQSAGAAHQLGDMFSGMQLRQ